MLNSTEIYKADLSDFLIQGAFFQLSHSSIRELQATELVVGAVVRSRLTPNSNILVSGARADKKIRQLRDDADFAFDATAVCPIRKEQVDEGQLFETKKELIAIKWPFEENSFDVVACTQDFSRLVDPKATLSEFLRITKHSGSLCIVIQSGGQLLASKNREEGFEKTERVSADDLENMISESDVEHAVRIPCTITSHAFLIRK